MLGGFIVSKYIDNPLLIGGRKFDLRLYTLVTSFKPLVAYLHRDGFARFCATRYTSDCFSEEALGAHLTNVALQKGDAHYNTTHGGKWSFHNVFLYIQSRYGTYVAEGLMTSIEFLIYHSLKAMENVMYNDKHSFELYGYDILIDGNIRPHLIEVNASPSLSVTTTSDRLMKEEVLSDAMRLVIPPGYPSSRAMSYWEYRTRTDLTANIKTGFKLLQF
ncbi:tubulin tyrosine ligase [Strigomonas culicis]|uniref:Tubulin tyrosine ligase n=1 Tax=Strigomonas culicis TaxID=28005 RepID=S9USW9_9TRYP|nr:tubulin tyrosine ligase [Strigomonas culicis]|eukprot:EPY17626.1 tubulin tyrosine ligase [Strigomonas culicis]